MLSAIRVDLWVEPVVWLCLAAALTAAVCGLLVCPIADSLSALRSPRSALSRFSPSSPLFAMSTGGSDLVELVHSLQTQLSQRGAGAFRTLQQAFDVNDRDRTGMFDFQEIEAILAKAGLFLKVTLTCREQGNGGLESRDLRSCVCHPLCLLVACAAPAPDSPVPSFRQAAERARVLP